MISERILKKWRRIALLTKAAGYQVLPNQEVSDHAEILADFVLELTQELLDQRLVEQKQSFKKENSHACKT